MSNNLLPLVARILIAIIFLKSGIYKIQHFESTSKFMYESGLTLGTDFFLAGAIFLLLAGSISLITGYKSKVGAFMLIMFLVPTTIAFHWDLNDPSDLIRNGVFVAALLLIMSYGTGDLSIGKKSKN
jgi:uncharacterized membrane protein YphA (DoxX/SURF4 family)